MPLMIFGFLALTGVFATAQMVSPPPAPPTPVPCIVGCDQGSYVVQPD